MEGGALSSVYLNLISLNTQYHSESLSLSLSVSLLAVLILQHRYLSLTSHRVSERIRNEPDEIYNLQI